MFNKIEGGSTVVIQGLTCWIPPVGYGIHVETGEIKRVDIIKRSNVAAEQYWEAVELPIELEDWKAEEDEMKKDNPTYVHQDLLKIKQREWHRRLYGVWFHNRGKDGKSEMRYLSGLHYYYLNYWNLDIGLPDFRIIDWEYFIFWQYCVFDPKCFGLIEIRKRRDGKTYRATCILEECISRCADSHAGIQSKNKDDSQEVFQIKLIPPFQALPFFFKPTYDTTKGDAPKELLSFFRTAQKGKLATRREKIKELRSTIGFKDSKPKAYDGRKLKRLLLDESGKTEVNILNRHKVVKYCLMDQRRRVIGKMIVTTTVEEIGVRFGFKDLWKQSNQFEKEKGGSTKSGLYKFFIPASRSGDYDVYGYPEEKETLAAILADRKSFINEPDELNDLIRKEPLTEEEAFRISSQQCHFNVVRLNDRLDELSGMENYKERGDFYWENGIRDTKVKWQRNTKGRWEIAWMFDKPEQTNNSPHFGSSIEPGNAYQFVAGCDPFDHDTVEDYRRSNAASFVLKRNDPFGENQEYNKAFVCKYLARPETANIFFEDMIKQCHFYGSPLLVEDNKPGLLRYFKDRGYSRFLIRIPGKKEPGIPSTQENKITGLEIMQDYVINFSDRMFFPDLIHDLIAFDVKDTQKYDLTMAALWTLMADMHRMAKRNMNEVKDINSIFKLYKAS
jgi:hypothetical protein